MVRLILIPHQWMHGLLNYSLRGHSVENVGVGLGDSGSALLEEPDTNDWNKVRILSDEEIEDLAKAIVKQVKLRALSFYG